MLFTVACSESSAHTHKWGAWKVLQEASCDREGIRQRACTICGETDRETVEMTEHTPVTDEAIAVTCTKDGKTEGSHCTVCGKVLVAQETIKAKGHQFSLRAPYECSICGESGDNADVGIDVLYQREAQEVQDALFSVKSEDSVNYIFITDLHNEYYPTEVARQLNIAVEMANNPDNNIDFIVIGGDITTGMYSTLDGYRSAVDAALAPLNKSKVPVMILMGNHDDNSYYAHYDGRWKVNTEGTQEEVVERYQQMLDETVVSDEYWKANVLDVYATDNNTEDKHISRVHDTKNGNSVYYYYDLAEKNTRIICLNGTDYGGATAYWNHSDSCHYGKYGAVAFGYSERQLEWLAEEALTAEDGWDYIFFSHVGYEYTISMEVNGSFDYATMQAGDYVGVGTLHDIIKAYQNHDNYNSGFFVGDNDTIKADFSNATGKILSFQFGHTHSGLLYNDESTGIVNVNTPSAKLEVSTWTSTTTVLKPTYIGNRSAYSAKERISGEISEAVFDVVSVNAADEKVTQIRFGAHDFNVSTRMRTLSIGTPDPAEATYGVRERNKMQAEVERVTDSDSIYYGAYKYVNLVGGSVVDRNGNVGFVQCGSLAFTSIEDELFYNGYNHYVVFDIALDTNTDYITLSGGNNSHGESTGRYLKTVYVGNSDGKTTDWSEDMYVYTINGESYTRVTSGNLEHNKWYRIYIPVPYDISLGRVTYSVTYILAADNTESVTGSTAYLKNIHFENCKL